MIHFDPKTLASWKANNIREISLDITNKGCAGNKIHISEYKVPHMDMFIMKDDLKIWLMKKYSTKIKDARITWTGKQWILTSESINTRCGCGSSFSLKSGNPLQDKIAQMKYALKERKGVSHSNE